MMTNCSRCGDPVELDSTIPVADGRDLCPVCILPYIQCNVCTGHVHYSQVATDGTCVKCLDAAAT
jgi:hypothetical protein